MTTKRLKNGMRESWKGGLNNLPTEEHKIASKASLDLNQRGRFLGTCFSCETSYDIPSEFVCIQEHGLCFQCKHFAEGKSDGVIVRRMPTLDEALAADPNDI